MIVNIWQSLRKGEKASANPWGSPTLEWSIPSPPHHYNFPKLPTVQTREPLWRHPEAEQVLADTMMEPETEPEMPGPSFWPILTAFGAALTWILMMTNIWWMPLIGLAFTAVCVYSWAFEDPFKGGHAH